TVVHDTRGDAGEAANGYRRLAADPGIVAVLGPMLSWEAAAVRNETTIAGLPAVSFSQRAFPPGPPFYRFSMSKEDQVVALAGYLVSELGLARWAILHPDDAFGSDMSLLFRDRVESLGGRVAAVVSYEPRQTDFQKEVQQLQARIGVRHEKEGPLELFVDGIFLPDSVERVQLLAPTLAFFDIRGVTLAGTHGWNDGAKLLQALPYVDGSIFVDGFFLYSFFPPVRSFVNAFRDAYGSDPGILEAYGYDAAMLLLEEIDAGAVERRRMIEHMHRPRLRAGATGWTTRTATGELQKQLFLLTVKEGTIREIERAQPPEPPPVARPVLPVPAVPTRKPGTGYWKRPEFDSRAPGTLGEPPPVPILPPQSATPNGR
ncbi:MAG: penicillin-binding protein activator, partial [Candidatus Binatia bacterium]